MIFHKKIFQSVTAPSPLFLTPQKTCLLKEKIRIGYVLKSADVGTLFSGRNSENSSHTYAHTSPHIATPAHTLLRTPTHTYPPAHTHTHLHTPHTYPLIPADALNLTNHMKLHVNGNM